MANCKTNKNKNQKYKKTSTQKCRLCGISHLQHQMTSVPKNPEKLTLWIEILGQQFAKNARKIKNPFICRKHINNNYEKFGRLPWRKNNSSTSAAVGKINSSPEVAKVHKQKRTQVCRYCGISRPFDDMSLVPKNRQKLTKWINILGPQFAEDVLKFKHSYICYDHFQNRNRTNSNLPMKINSSLTSYADSIGNDAEQIEEELSQITTNDCNDNYAKSKPRKSEAEYGNPANSTKMQTVNCSAKIGKLHEYKSTQVCRYCGIPRHQSDMTRVTTNSEKLSKWIDILGPIFAENIKKYDTNYICCAHFDSRDKISSSSPIRMDSFPTTSKADIIEEDNEEKAEELPQMEKIDNGADCSNFVPIKGEAENADDSSSTEMQLCRVCGIKDDMKTMTPIPTSAKVLQNWMNILGPEFSRNIVYYHSPHFICLHHLIDILPELCKA